MSGIRINVIGGSGSGTSTLGRSLASALSLPHFESDAYFHVPSDPPYQNQRPAEERYQLICRDLGADGSWVLSGGIADWNPYPELSFTCVVFLYVPTAIRIERLRHRERARFGSRIEVGGDMYDTHREFINWASRYDEGGIEGKTLARHQAYLASQQCPVLEYRGVLPLSDITADVLRSIGSEGHDARSSGETTTDAG